MCDSWIRIVFSFWTRKFIKVLENLCKSRVYFFTSTFSVRIKVEVNKYCKRHQADISNDTGFFCFKIIITHHENSKKYINELWGTLKQY